MKKLSVMLVVLAALVAAPVRGQQGPAAPAGQTAEQREIQRQAEVLQAQMETLAEKLHGITQFQQYLQVQQQLQQLQVRYNAAAAKAEVGAQR